MNLQHIVSKKYNHTRVPGYKSLASAASTTLVTDPLEEEVQFYMPSKDYITGTKVVQENGLILYLFPPSTIPSLLFLGWILEKPVAESKSNEKDMFHPSNFQDKNNPNIKFRFIISSLSLSLSLPLKFMKNAPFHPPKDLHMELRL